jgi:hypothetical protein
MAELPSANVTIDDEAGAFGGGSGYVAIFGVVPTNADMTPRVFNSTKGLIAQHGYSTAVAYAAMHFSETKKPVIFLGLPADTAGMIGSQDETGVTGTCVITVTAGSDGVMAETEGEIVVTRGGTIGTDQIEFTLSLDGGRSTKKVRLGTANSYTVPYVGIVLNFAAGTLIADDTFTFRTIAPKWASTDLATARAALAAQSKLTRTWLVVGDLLNATEAGYVTTQVNAYETSNDRFTLARCSVQDRLPLAKKSKVVGQTLTFAEVGASSDTITRSAGSWIADGFKVGDKITISGSVSNNITTTQGIAALTATVITLGTDDLAAEVATESTFASVDSQKRIDLSLGRARKQCPVTGWLFRLPPSFAASLREYQHDLHIPTWRKSDGPVDGWSLEDEEGNTVEFDERIDGGALAGRFTCFRSYANGPNGTFLALSLTRASEGSLLSRTHNMQVANLACTVCLAETENAIGQVLQLNADGTGTEASLSLIEERVNTALQTALLVQGKEGPRASSAVWRASRTDVLNVVGAELNGVLDLLLNGTLEKITTVVKIQTAG